MLDFNKVSSIDVSKMTEEKNGLTYLSWAMAWKEFCKVYPNARYEIVKNENNLPYFKDDEVGYMVYTRVTVDELTHEMWLPVLDFKNKPMMKPNMFDINKTVMRCLTKNLAMFGLGLHVYTGEDLPTEDDTPEPKQPKKKEKPIERNVEELDRQAMLKETPVKLQNKQAGYYENVLKFFKLPEDTPIEKLSDKHLKTLYDNLNK